MHKRDVLAALHREVKGVADAALDAHAGVDRTLGAISCGVLARSSPPSPA